MRSIAKCMIAALAVCVTTATATAGVPGMATLYGISSGGASELHVIDASTGSSESFLALGLDAVGANTVALSADGTALYVAGVVGGVPTLKSIAPFVATIGTATLDRAFATLEVRGDGVPVGLVRNGATWELRSIDPGTGTSTLLGVVPELAVLVPTAGALDPSSGSLHQIGYSSTRPSVAQLFTIDAATGAFVDTVEVDRTYHSLAVRGDGALLGTGLNGPDEELVEIDPGTGISSLITTFPAFGVLPPAASTVDLANGVVYQVGYVASAADPPHLFGVGAGGVGAPTDVALGRNFLALVHASSGPVLAAEEPVRHSLGLSPARPNPFTGTTQLVYSLDRATHVTIEVVDVMGRVVHRLANQAMQAGNHTLAWRGRDDQGRKVPVGVYFARMRAAGREFTQRIVLMQ